MREANGLPSRAGGMAMAFGLLLSLGILLFWDAFPADLLLSLKDAGHLVLASKIRIAAAIRDATLPLWDPTIGGGVPMLADPVFQVLYPGNLLLLVTSPIQTLKYFAFLHLVLAGLAVSQLARHSGASHSGSLIGALVFMGSGAIVSLHWNPPWMAGLPWLLFSILYTRRLLGGRGGWGTSAILAVTLALLLLSGAFEVALAYLVYTTVEVVAFGLPLMRRNRQPSTGISRFQPVGLLAAAGGVATGLAACQLLPTYELLAFSQRAQGVINLEANLWSLPAGRLLELASPHLFGNPALGTPWTALLHSSFANQPFLSGIYVGVPALALGLAGLTRIGNRDRWLLSAMLLVTGCLALGDTTPFFELARRTIPAFGLFRYPAKILAITMIPLALLGAAGASGLLERRSTTVRVLKFSCLGLGSLLFLCWLGGHLFRDSLLHWIEAGIQREHLELSSVAVWESATASLLRGLAPALLLGALAFGIRKMPAHLPTALLLLLVMLDLGLANRQLIATRRAEEFLAVPSQFPPVQRLREPAGTTRIAQDPNHRALVPHLVSLYGFRSADSYGSMTVGNSVIFDASLRERPEMLLALKSVRFVIEQPGSDAPLTLREIGNTLPRAFLAPRAAVAIDDEAVIRYVRAPGFDPRQEILLSDAPLEASEWATSSVSSEEARVIMVLDDAEEITVQVETPVQGYLLLNDTWYPGWEARVNGDLQPVFRANLNSRAVPIPAGRSEVRFSYRPASVPAGLQISGLSLILLGWLISLAYRLPGTGAPRREA